MELALRHARLPLPPTHAHHPSAPPKVLTSRDPLKQLGEPLPVDASIDMPSGDTATCRKLRPAVTLLLLLYFVLHVVLDAYSWPLVQLGEVLTMRLQSREHSAVMP